MIDLVSAFILFLIIALVLTILGVRGAAMSMEIAKIIGAIIIVLIILTLVFGGSFLGGGAWRL
jgi:uncharacterized membrane protein YtjA (UPF0391 family)